ncbi:MAG: tRNA (guanosine(37)-N1)-methyltransferase TrmD [Oscillospiraceae bacterium]|jgi:tRNA (guanine37-N1)-methyltransferase|nr:tRNA (guanosine(37)-N1)-methyltransferase TrmD [Oscillospiraceae bacterium]
MLIYLGFDLMSEINIDVMTLFPEICQSTMHLGVVGRAIKGKIIDLKFYQIRDFSQSKHKKVDDSPFGGGNGMVMMAEPIFRAFEHICSVRSTRPRLIFMSPKGRVLTQKIAKNMLENKNIAFLCGRYEAVDERLIEEIVDDQISIGDYVLTGGELPAMVMIDAMVRMIKGVLASDKCFEEESFYNGMLEHPQYTRPRVWRDRNVPEVLLSGNHKEIKKWKLEQNLKSTLKLRPDLKQDSLRAKIF